MTTDKRKNEIGGGKWSIQILILAEVTRRGGVIGLHAKPHKEIAKSKNRNMLRGDVCKTEKMCFSALEKIVLKFRW
jgi:hypothetical protein